MGAETGAELPTQGKKRQKTPQKPEELEAPRQFTPFDYSKSNFKVFAGKIWSLSRVLHAVEMLPAEPWEGCVSVGASAIQTVRTFLPYRAEILQEIDLRNTLASLYWFGNKILKQLAKWGVDLNFLFSYLFNWSLELRGKGDLTPL